MFVQLIILLQLVTFNVVMYRLVNYCEISDSDFLNSFSFFWGLIQERLVVCAIGLVIMSVLLAGWGLLYCCAAESEPDIEEEEMDQAVNAIDPEDSEENN